MDRRRGGCRASGGGRGGFVRGAARGVGRAVEPDTGRTRTGPPWLTPVVCGAFCAAMCMCRARERVHTAVCVPYVCYALPRTSSCVCVECAREVS